MKYSYQHSHQCWHVPLVWDNRCVTSFESDHYVPKSATSLPQGKLLLRLFLHKLFISLQYKYGALAPDKVQCLPTRLSCSYLRHFKNLPLSVDSPHPSDYLLSCVSHGVLTNHDRPMWRRCRWVSAYLSVSCFTCVCWDRNRETNDPCPRSKDAWYAVPIIYHSAACWQKKLQTFAQKDWPHLPADRRLNLNDKFKP